MTNVFDVVGDKVKEFTLSITTKEKKIMQHIKTLSFALEKLGFEFYIEANGNTYIMHFKSNKDVDVDKILNVVLEKIKEFSSDLKDSEFDISDLGKGNLKDVSKIMSTNRLVEL